MALPLIASSIRARLHRSWGAGALALYAALACGSAGGPAAAETQTLVARADEVKAAYVYKFVDYIVWPASAFPAADSPLVIGVAGNDQVHAELARLLVGRTAHGRPLTARKVVPGDPVEGVHLIFVGDAGLVRSPWFQRLRDRALLVVADAPSGLEAGAALNFVQMDDRLRFEASLRAVERSGLKMSSRLLSLAQRVVPAP